MINQNNEFMMIPTERIIKRIFVIRGKKVMIDKDLADLYNVSTKRLNEQVRRNIERFPNDFMFRLNLNETETLRSQIATSKGRGGRRYFPYAFTENGVAMLSSVLNSKKAIQVNIQIMRSFTKLREMLATNEQLRRKIEEMEKKYDQKFVVVFEAIKQLISTDEKRKNKKPIRFVLDK